MVAQTVKVVNEQGLHMRPAGVFAKEMTKFSCAVTLDVAGKKINAKSVMLIIAACIKCGAEVTVECDGADERRLLQRQLSSSSQDSASRTCRCSDVAAGK